MNTLLVAATSKEIAPFLDHYKRNTSLHIDILITGVGLVAATYHLTKQIQLRRPGLIVQAGIAGCFDEQIPLGTVIAVKEDRIADLGVLEGKDLLSVFDLGLATPDELPYSKGWLKNGNELLIKKTGLKAVKGISVNQVSTSSQMIQLYQNKFKPATESMEGAALHYICICEKIPFLQLRGISNYVGERNKKNWDLKGSITNLNTQLIRFFENQQPVYAKASAGKTNNK